MRRIRVSPASIQAPVELFDEIWHAHAERLAPQLQLDHVQPPLTPLTLADEGLGRVSRAASSSWVTPRRLRASRNATRNTS